jgi:molybdopterin-guanine dinucleotide biosynthesis protein A
VISRVPPGDAEDLRGTRDVTEILNHDVSDAEKMPGVTGIVLAGGKNVRLRIDKMSLRVHGESVFDKMLALFGQLFERTVISVAASTRASLPGYETVTDRFPGSLGGMYSGLSAARTDVAFVAACDMPFISADLVRYQAQFAWDYDVVIPRGRAGLEPLHAFYSKRCLEPIHARLREGKLTIRGFFDEVRVKEIGLEEIAQFDPEELSFFNINTQTDLLRAEEIKQCMAVRS